MKKAIVDENVPRVANDDVRIRAGKTLEAPNADEDCRRASVRTLDSLRTSGIVVIDEGGELLKAYRKNLNPSGQPGAGDAFYKHVRDNRYDDTKVLRTSLMRNGNGDFEIFPTSDERLRTFDHSDRIFVALALATPGNPPILNATDSDYHHHAQALAAHCVRVEELCRDCLKPASPH